MLAQDHSWAPLPWPDSTLTPDELTVTSSGTLLASNPVALWRRGAAQNWTAVGPRKSNDFLELPDQVVLAAGWEGVFRSPDDGSSWVEVIPKPRRDECGDILQYTFLTARPDRTTFVGGIEENRGSAHCKAHGIVYSSDDSGRDWKPLPETFFDSTDALWLTADTLIVSPNGGGLYWYVGEENWHPHILSLMEESLISIQDDQDGNLFAATGSDLNGLGEGTGIYRSRDGGESWEPINNGLTDSTITDLVIREHQLVVGTRSGGVFVSEDAGDHWKPVNAGLSSLKIKALTATPDGILIASTAKGLYRTRDPIFVGKEEEAALPARAVLSSNYPNPFAASTTIPFHLAEPAHVRLVVYDLLGREIEVILDDFRPAGSYHETFDARGHPSGTYFYRLQAGDRILSKPMQLAK